MTCTPGLIPGYFESAAVITTLVLLGQVLELRARARTSGALKQLLGLAPKTAIVVFDDGTETEVELKEHPERRDAPCKGQREGSRPTA